MKKLNSSFLLRGLFLLAISFLISACKTNHPLTQQDRQKIIQEFDANPVEGQKQFFHAWIANEAAFLFYKGKAKAYKKIQKETEIKLKSTLKDSLFSNAFGKDELVWGPALSVSDVGGGSFGTRNFLYCVKSKEKGKEVYSVGIAGTNLISPYGWFSEDLNVKESVEWMYGGKISKGSKIGFDILNELKDKNSGENLVTFLKSVIKNPKETKIEISGHSLGGALTQVYSSYLKNQIPQTRVEAWVFAGPTAGDANFAKKLVADLDIYQAFNNELDLIPHTWQKNKLNQMCSLFANTSLCDKKLKTSPVVNGLVTYFKGMSGHLDYTIPGNPHTFSVKPLEMTPNQCRSFNSDVGAFWKLDLYKNVYNYANSIVQHCENRSITEAEYIQMFYFLDQMGYQHVKAYLNHFIPQEKMRTALENHMQEGDSKFTKLLGLGKGLHIFEGFLQRTDNYISENKIEDCSCQKE